jgi:hypothetical protein
MPIPNEPCPHCGAKCLSFEQSCADCGWELRHIPSTAQPETILPEPNPTYLKVSERKRMLGLTGSLILFIGVFTPIISLPIVGSLNYFQNGQGDGVIIIVLAIISLVLALTKKYGGLWLTGLASLALMTFTFINFQVRMSDAKAQMESQLSGNPFRGLADVAMQSIQIQWGWAVMIVGASLLIAAAAIKTPAQYDAA